MKKTVMVIFLFTALLAKAQTYHPFPDSGIVWIQEPWYTDFTPVIPCTVHDYHNLYISGDTTIGVYSYHKLYADGFTWANCPPPGFYYYGKYICAFRQDTLNKQVYMHVNSGDYLAYDFNLNVGDTLAPGFLLSETNYVESIDSILIGTQYHKRFWLSSLVQPAINYASLIEGIGPSIGAFQFMLPAFESGSDLYCVLINNQPVWSNPQFPNMQCSLLAMDENQNKELEFTINPNPLTGCGVITVDEGYKNASLNIYNAIGQQVRTLQMIDQTATIRKDGLSKGIYFMHVINKNGEMMSKKFVVE